MYLSKFKKEDVFLWGRGHGHVGIHRWYTTDSLGGIGKILDSTIKGNMLVWKRTENTVREKEHLYHETENEQQFQLSEEYTELDTLLIQALSKWALKTWKSLRTYKGISHKN